MKKKLLIAICVLLTCLLLIPIPLRLKDGGTVVYQAILYSVEDIHRLTPDANTKFTNPYIDGIRVKVLGIEVFHREK